VRAAIGRRFTPAAFALVFAARRGVPLVLIAWLSFPQS
jgi:hypothetical protein